MSEQAKFNEQVTDIRDRQITAATDDAEGGYAQMTYKRGLAAGKRPDIVELSRRLAREVAANGPVTIDDVTRKLFDLQIDNPDKVDANKPKNWKGSIFATSEWVAVGKTPSRIPSNHARVVTMWCLKSWLQNNSLNGTNMSLSRFYTQGIFSDFKRKNPQADLKKCVWYIGMSSLSDQTLSEIKVGGGKLYGCPVYALPGAVGAILVEARG